MRVSLLDPSLSASSAPNYVCDFTPGPPLTSSLGTISLRRKITNNTGGNVTRLRLRVVDVTTYPAGGEAADYRVLSSGSTVVPLTGGGSVTAQGFTADPPDYPTGHGLQSGLRSSTITLNTPLPLNSSIYVNLTLGVETDGEGRFAFVVEALP